MQSVGRPSFISKSIDELNVGTYDDLLVVSTYAVSRPTTTLCLFFLHIVVRAHRVYSLCTATIYHQCVETSLRKNVANLFKWINIKFYYNCKGDSAE